MGANATSWPPGVSGNPTGRPKVPATLRSLRSALAAPASPGSTETVLDRWTRELVDGARTTGERLAVLEFLARLDRRAGARS